MAEEAAAAGVVGLAAEAAECEPAAVDSRRRVACRALQARRRGRAQVVEQRARVRQCPDHALVAASLVAEPDRAALVPVAAYQAVVCRAAQEPANDREAWLLQICPVVVGPRRASSGIF